MPVEILINLNLSFLLIPHVTPAAYVQKPLAKCESNIAIYSPHLFKSCCIQSSCSRNFKASKLVNLPYHPDSQEIIFFLYFCCWIFSPHSDSLMHAKYFQLLVSSMRSVSLFPSASRNLPCLHYSGSSVRTLFLNTSVSIICYHNANI